MRRVGRELRLWVAVAAVVAAACSPSSTVESGSEITPATVPVTVDGLVVTRAEEPACASNWDLVEADRVVAEHELTSDERRIVDWALGRFVEAGLLLPNEIEFAFDPTAEACAGNIGNCRPPNGIAKARVCLPVPEAAHKRGVVLLHELAHLWDWAQGDGLDWPDRSEIVGGVPRVDGVEWADRSSERVAEVVTWGLYDGAVRPYTLGLPDSEVCEQYEALTGSLPPEPARSYCQVETAS